EQSRGNLTEARRRGDLEALLHVGDDASGGAPQRHRLLLHGCRLRRGLLLGRRRGQSGCRWRRDRRGLVLVASVVREELLPALTDGARIREVLLVHLVDQPLVGSERAGRSSVFGHFGRSYRRENVKLAG